MDTLYRFGILPEVCARLFALRMTLNPTNSIQLAECTVSRAFMCSPRAPCNFARVRVFCSA